MVCKNMRCAVVKRDCHIHRRVYLDGCNALTVKYKIHNLSAPDNALRWHISHQECYTKPK